MVNAIVDGQLQANPDNPAEPVGDELAQFSPVFEVDAP